MTDKQELIELKMRYNSMCEAAQKDKEEIGKLVAECSSLKSTVIRLGAETAAAQQNAQLLGDDYNERARAAAAEVGELRSRLREAGLSTEVN